MLPAIRRYGVVQALRASTPRVLYAKSCPQLLKWQRPVNTAFPAIIRSLHDSPAFRQQASAAAQVQADAAEPAQQKRFTEFADLAKEGLVDHKIIDSISQMKITTMTDVQSFTLNVTLGGKDVLAQAKTGTGKTLAFLIPTLQNILNDPTWKPNEKQFGRRASRPSAADIRAIIISPTRELAEQIAVEAKKVAKNTPIVVQTAVGGTRKREGLHRIQTEGCHVLIGTPGRLHDILSDHRTGVRAPNLTTLVLDEADRLLDEGFAPDIHRIEALLPDPTKVDRQTLMFSATVPHEVISMVNRAMKPDYQFVKTVRDGEVPTHLSVPQKSVFLRGFENALPAILELSKAAIAKGERPFKAIVYFNATAQTELAYEVFCALRVDPTDLRSPRPLGATRIFGIHSRLNQGKRTRNSDDFRRAKSAILFSSDVTARGMDFPDVTHVIQVGVPRDRPTYIHRLGRTARANKAGEGWILLHDAEFKAFERKLGDLPIEEDSTSLQTASVDMTSPQVATPSISAEESLAQVKGAMTQVPDDIKVEAYRAGLAVSSSVFHRKNQMVTAYNQLSVHGYGMSEPPTIPLSTAQNLGIERVPQLRIESRPSARFARSEGDSSFARRGNGDRGHRGGGFQRDRRGGEFQRDRRGGEFQRDRRGGEFEHRRGRSSNNERGSRNGGRRYSESEF